MKLFNLIKRAVVSRKTEDSGQFPVAQVKWNGKTADIETIWPYGMAGNLPEGAIVLMFNVNGQEENKAGIGNTPKDRHKDFEPGEIGFGHPLTKSVVKFLNNGDIEITSVNNQIINITGNVSATIGGTLTAEVTGDTTLTSPTTTLNGSLRVSGDITAFYQGTPIVMSNIRTQYNAHTHDENDSAPAPTNVTNQPLP